MVNDSLCDGQHVVIGNMGKTGGKQCTTALSSVKGSWSVDIP